MTIPDEEAVKLPWRYSINYGPDGEENYANVYAPDGSLVGNLQTRHARAIVDAGNSSPPLKLEDNPYIDEHVFITSLVSPPTQAGGEPVPVAWRVRERYPMDPRLDAAVITHNRWEYHPHKPRWAGEDNTSEAQPLYAAPIASKEACGDGVREALSDAISAVLKLPSYNGRANLIFRTDAIAALRALTPNPGSAE